jgi:hypothetical protein
MSATLTKLGEMEKAFLLAANWLEIVSNDRPDYLTNIDIDRGIYIVDLDFDHMGVTLMGKPERTTRFREDLSLILENTFKRYAASESWKGITFS